MRHLSSHAGVCAVLVTVFWSANASLPSERGRLRGETIDQAPGNAGAAHRITVREPASPAPGDATANSQIERLLDEYCLAYEHLAVEDVQRVYPSVPDNRLKRAFRQYRRLS